MKTTGPRSNDPALRLRSQPAASEGIVAPEASRALMQKLSSALGFNPNLSLGELVQISIALYEPGQRGPSYEALKAKWTRTPIFKRIKRISKKPKKKGKVMNAFAEMRAQQALTIQTVPPLVQTTVNTAKRVARRHFDRDFKPKTMVVGAGNVGIVWLRDWPQDEKLILLDLNLFVCRFLEHSVRLVGRTNVEVVKGDFLKYPYGKGRVNYVVSSQLFPYLTLKQIEAFYGVAAQTLSLEPEERLLFMAEALPVPDHAPALRQESIELAAQSGLTLQEEPICTEPGVTRLSFVYR